VYNSPKAVDNYDDLDILDIMDRITLSTRAAVAV
jgi:hypothetical protein